MEGREEGDVVLPDEGHIGDNEKAERDPRHCFAFSEDEREGLLSVVRGTLKDALVRGSGPKPVSLVEVRGCHSQPMAFFVPHARPYWGILVGEFVFVVVLSVDADGGKPEAITFACSSANAFMTRKEIERLGTTSCSVEEMLSVAQAVASAMGSYHSAYWNCGVMLDAFLDAVCDEQHGSLSDMDLTAEKVLAVHFRRRVAPARSAKPAGSDATERPAEAMEASDRHIVAAVVAPIADEHRAHARREDRPTATEWRCTVS